MVFGSFLAISKSANIVGSSGDVLKMAYSCIERMSSDLEAVYVAQKPGYVKPGFDSEPDPYRIEGGTDMVETETFPWLRFTTRNHLPINRDSRTGIAEVVYYVHPFEDGEFVLVRADRLHFGEELDRKGNHPVLCRRLKSMTVTYIDSEGEEHDDWDSESEENGYATPDAVNIKIEINDDGYAVPFETRILLHSAREKSE